MTNNIKNEQIIEERKQAMMLQLSKLSDEEFEEFKENFSGEYLKAIETMRFWSKMQHSKEFYNKVRDTLAHESYQYF